MEIWERGGELTQEGVTLFVSENKTKKKKWKKRDWRTRKKQKRDTCRCELKTDSWCSLIERLSKQVEQPFNISHTHTPIKWLTSQQVSLQKTINRACSPTATFSTGTTERGRTKQKWRKRKKEELHKESEKVRESRRCVPGVCSILSSG